MDKHDIHALREAQEGRDGKSRQMALAKLLRVSFDTINSWENGRRTPSAQAEYMLNLVKKGELK